MVRVLLDQISNILSVAKSHGQPETVSQMIEECRVLDQLVELLDDENENLRQKSLTIIQTFFTIEEGVRVSVN